VAVSGSPIVYQAILKAQAGFQGVNPGTSLALTQSSDDMGLAALQLGSAGVAAISRPLTASEAAIYYSWKIGYQGTRPLYVVMQKWSRNGVLSTDDSQLTKAKAFVNFLASPAGQTAVAGAQVGGVNFSAVTPYVPIPAYDVNLDGNINVLDVGNLIGRWGQNAGSGCKGWIRADINNDGIVNVLDIGQVINHWGQHPTTHP
jgi:hypothetical protein